MHISKVKFKRATPMKSIMNVGVDHVTTYSSANKVQSRSSGTQPLPFPVLAEFREREGAGSFPQIFKKEGAGTRLDLECT